MALLWIEGFEGGGTSSSTLFTYLTRKWSYCGISSIYFGNVSGRFGGRACVAERNVAIFSYRFDSTQTIIVGFAFKTTAMLASYDFIRLDDNNSAQIQLMLTVAGEIEIYRGTTLLGTSIAAGLLVNTWYYIELKVTIDNTVGTYEVRVDGKTVLIDAAVDTQETVNAYVNTLYIMGPHYSADYYYDDMYLLDTTGTRNNDFLGNMKVTMISPDADTADEDFTPQAAGDNYAEVDDGATADDATYNESGTPEDKDIFGYADASSIENIAGVMINTEAMETDANDFKIKTLVRTNSTVHKDSAQNISPNYKIITRLLEDDPNTATQWSLSTLNAAEFGYEVE